jgi:uncharacterized protein YegL
VKLLLERGASVDARDQSYGGTPLGWALYAWGAGTEEEVREVRSSRQSYYDTVALLMRAGAKLDEGWYKDDPDRQRAWNKMRSDPRMRAAVAGKTSRED